MIVKANLKILLQELLEGLLSETDLTKLIHLCRSIAESHFTQHQTSLVHICSLNGLTVSDLAFDCIAQVFTRNEAGRFYQFERFVDSLNTNLEETREPELFLAVKSFVLRIAKTQLAKIYAQSDPVGARIHRNIKEYLKKSPSLELVEDFRGYVLQPTNHDPLDHLAAFPLEHLERDLRARVRGSANIPELLEALLAVLIEQKEYRRSTPLLEVVQVFKRFYLRISDVAASEFNLWDPEELSQLDIEVLQREVQRTVQEKIISTYFLTGKVTKKGVEALSATMWEIIDDWCQGQDTHTTLYQHLGRYIPISQSEYETQWRTKLEYLTRIARERFAACLMKNI